MKHLLIIFAIALAGCNSEKTPGRMSSLKAGPLSYEESAEIMRVEAIGKAIFQKDIIASKATDILLSKRVDVGPHTVKGWIVTSDDKGYLVRFINEINKELRPVFDVRLSNEGQETFHDKDLPPLSDEQKAMFLARQNALKSAPLYCSDRYNTVVLRNPDSDGWIVYVLAATTDSNIVVVGGHSCVSVSQNGRKAISVTPLSKSCLAVDKSKKPKQAPSTVFPFALVVSHLISDTPSEIHVYLNYLHGDDIYVVTKTRFWKISEGKISILDPQSLG
jgi:hypothetical protein